MSYTKDPDRFTRGPGAIAARDNKRRFAHRVAMSRASDVRDRALSQYTFGPQGGLGAIKEVEMPDDPKPSGGSGSGAGSGAGTTTPPRRPRYIVGVKPVGIGPRGTTGTNTGAYPRPPVDVIVDPAPPLPPPMPPPYAPPVVSGGGGVNTGPLPPISVPDMAPPMVPDDLPPPGQGIDLKKAAMIGGAAVAIWYLFLRNKGG